MIDNHPSGAYRSAAGRHRRPLVIAFGLTAAYMVVEVVAGLLVGSLALLSDAGHMLTDVAGLGMALAAVQLAQGRRDPSHTYGLYRLEMLAALANAILLVAVAGYVLFEAYRRLTAPPEVLAVPLLVVAGVGLIVNIVCYRLLRSGAKESMNVRGAFLEVLADLIGSMGVIVAGLVLLITGWSYIDPIVGAGIGLLILPRAFRLGWEALRALLEIAPSGMDVQLIEGRLAALPGVAGLHDFHLWTLTSGLTAATGHLLIADGARPASVLQEATTLLRRDFGIEHVTLQCEPRGFEEPAQGI